MPEQGTTSAFITYRRKIQKHKSEWSNRFFSSTRPESHQVREMQL